MSPIELLWTAKKDTKKGNRKMKSKKEKKGNKAERLFVNTDEETTTTTNVTSALACHGAAVSYMKLLSGKVPNISVSFFVDIFKAFFLFSKGGKLCEAEEKAHFKCEAVS